MPTIETFRKRAKQLQRWHRDHHYSVGGKVRLLARYADLSDRQVLEMDMPLSLAQEIVAVEAGFKNWPKLKAASSQAVRTPRAPMETLTLGPAVPVLFTKDVPTAALFYRDILGFSIDFLHGNPPFYGAVSRHGACLHLRHVGQPNFSEIAAREPSLILATISVNDVKALYQEVTARNVTCPQPLTQQPWGGLDFHIRDPDGNVISFVQYPSPISI